MVAIVEAGALTVSVTYENGINTFELNCGQTTHRRAQLCNQTALSLLQLLRRFRLQVEGSLFLRLVVQYRVCLHEKNIYRYLQQIWSCTHLLEGCG